MGVLLSAFLWPYAFALLVAGGLVDRWRPRRMLTSAMIVWSIAHGVAGFIVSYGQFLASRALLGAGEAPMFPTAARVVKDWYHESDQALGVGILNGAPALGTALAPALLTPVIDRISDPGKDETDHPHRHEHVEHPVGQEVLP
jgi:MFS family permease